MTIHPGPEHGPRDVPTRPPIDTGPQPEESRATQPANPYGLALYDAIRRYVDYGLHPGSFLEAVITNDLRGAVMHADADSTAHLVDYVRHFYNEEPVGCQGTPWRFERWLAQGGRVRS